MSEFAACPFCKDKSGNDIDTRPVTPLQAAERAFIEAYRKWHNAEGAATLDAALVMGGAWSRLQQLEGESK